MAEMNITSTEATAPLLRPRQGSSGEVARPSTLAMLLGRATGRRGPSMLVRETAARQLEERRVDWGYSKPVVALDMMWNLAFVIVSVVMLSCTVRERPNVPIRVWICGYALQCSVHLVLVWLEYRRRNFRRGRDEEGTRPAYQSDLNDSEEEDAPDGSVGVLGITNRSR